MGWAHFMPDASTNLAHGGAGNACGVHEIHGGTDDAARSQRSTCGQAPRRRLAPTPVTVVMPARLHDNNLPCEILQTDQSSQFLQVCPNSDRFAGV